MNLDPASAYQALVSRDRRFDGRFFVAVTTTGIYCRPICRVRTPKPSSCRFYEHAAAAEAAGFRPCLRCRPELAPGVSLIDSPDAIAHAAARLLDAGVGDAGLAAVAARVGVVERHLRRVFVRQFGVSPVEWLQTRRLLLAKQLLTETALSVSEVALAAGFQSLRRFNALFRQRYRLAPTQLRREGSAPAGDGLALALDYRPPYAWDALLAFFRARAVSGVESVDAQAYRRVVRLASTTGWIELRHAPERAQLRLAADPALARVLPALLAAVRRQFDLDNDPQRVAAALGELVREPGLRLPGSIDPFEQSVRAVLGQQVSVAAATTLAGRLVARFGTSLQTPHAGLTHVFPEPATIAGADPDELTALGVLATRARSIQALARAFAAGELRLDAEAPVEPTLERLRALPGIGEWTAQYIALRCLSWPDAFPHTDLIIRRAFGDLTPCAVLAAAERWRPWRGYATLHLWRNA
ncbi:MAG: DNA-3-methyladenine glycosylase 2 [Xanthomonadales bacterium PRO6]|nr:DNA-3-methyladenine glycosylase 2 [Xanthomonadales bacterium PRO6]